MKLNLDLCKTKSNKNELLENEIFNISKQTKRSKKSIDNSQKEIRPNLNIKNNIKNKIYQDNNSNIKINNNQKLPILNLKLSKLKPNEIHLYLI